jgi:hypothetical protein
MARAVLEEVSGCQRFVKEGTGSFLKKKNQKTFVLKAFGACLAR